MKLATLRAGPPRCLTSVEVGLAIQPGRGKGSNGYCSPTLFGSLTVPHQRSTPGDGSCPAFAGVDRMGVPLGNRDDQPMRTSCAQFHAE